MASFLTGFLYSPPPLKILKESVAQLFTTLFVIAGIGSVAMADDEVTATNIWTSQNSRFGVFNALDHRSGYFLDSFPEPLLVEETTAEAEGELEVNSLHTEAAGQQSDIVGAEFEKSVGVVTFEIGLQYQRFSDLDDPSQGISDIDLGVRCPFYQYVSSDGLLDDTIGGALESSIPVNTALSKNVELELAVFDDLKLGNHFTIQSVLDYSALIGGGEDGGAQSFEYGFDFAYTLPHEEFPIPGVLSFSPMFELNGELGLNEDEAGQNSVLGSMGFRIGFRPLGDTEPSIGVGYVFPMDAAAREEVHWGIVGSLILEF